MREFWTISLPHGEVSGAWEFGCMVVKVVL